MQVFISYANQDRDLARKLISELVRAGVEVWNPDEQIYPGDNWAEKTGQALESSEAMIALVTRDALQSGLLVHDVQFALTAGNYKGRVIPVLVDFVTFQAGKDVPWILLRLDPVYVQSVAPDFEPVIKRVQRRRTLAAPEFKIRLQD
jgi:hypothetical protein